MRGRTIVAMLSIVFLGVVQSVHAQSLNIDFGAQQGTPSNGFGAAANQPGTWNSVGLGNTNNLTGLNGSATSVDVSVTASSTSSRTVVLDVTNNTIEIDADAVPDGANNIGLAGMQITLAAPVPSLPGWTFVVLATALGLVVMARLRLRPVRVR
jgi:hypothetical protein